MTATLTGLSPGTTYHYRIEATNSAGTTTGTDATFMTAPPGPAPAPPGPGPAPPPVTAVPMVTTGAASLITEVSASVGGQVDSNGLATTYHLDYGRTVAYGSSTRAAPVGSGTSLIGISAHLEGLHASATYHYRLVASNGDGTSYGADRTFRTLPRLRLQPAGLLRFYRIGTIQQRGLGVAAHCDQPCSIRGLLVIPSASAKRLHLGKLEIVLGSGSARRTSRGTAHLRLLLTRKGGHLISGFKNLGVTLRLIATPISGGPAVSVSVHLTVNR